MMLAAANLPSATSQPPWIMSTRISGPFPVWEPDSSIWLKAAPFKIDLYGQNFTRPFLFSASVKSATLRTIDNGTWIGFQLEWKDPTRSVSTSRIQDYRDSVAVMFPRGDDELFIGMGERGKPVNILHWKADWQEDIDVFYRELEHVYPNMLVNFYPYTANDSPFQIPPIAKIDRTYVSGLAAGNILSAPVRLTPVEDLMAEGFGTLTTQPHQDAAGKGTWKDGIWRITIARPIVTNDGDDAQLTPGRSKPIAFAIWDGGNREVDGRKAVSLWHRLYIDARREGLTMPLEQFLFYWLLIIAALAFGATAFLTRSTARIRETSGQREE